MPLTIRLLIGLVFALAGCSSPRSLPLDREWRPLERVVEAGDRLLSRGVTVTLGKDACVADLDKWARLYPEGSIQRRAVLLHERCHAQRQLDAGLAPWLARYVADAAFRWREERLGWEQEVATLVRAGVRVDVEALSQILADDYVFFGARMVSRDEARAWLDEVIARARR